MAHFIGIDVHKKTSHVVVLDDETERTILDKNIRTTPERLTDVLAPLAPAKVLIEASTLSRWIADLLTRMGHDVVIGDPNNPLMYASRPANCKNDRNDARALAFARRAGHYKPIHRVSDAHRADQEVIGSRGVLVQTRTGLINRVRALHAARGLSVPGCDPENFWHIVGRKLVPELEGSVRPLLDVLAMLEDQISRCDKQIAARASKEAEVENLTTTPGIGALTALAFVAILDTTSRFAGAHKAESYVGLVGRVSVSARPGAGGPISKRGSNVLRRLLLQAAWSLMRSNDPRVAPLQEWANTLALRRGKQIAIVALARRLTGILFAMWRDGKPFELRAPKEERPAQSTQTPMVRRYPLKRRTTTAAA